MACSSLQSCSSTIRWAPKLRMGSSAPVLPNGRVSTFVRAPLFSPEITRADVRRPFSLHHTHPGPARIQRANSATTNVWSEGFFALRASTSIQALVDLLASRFVAQMWSTRHPMSLSSASGTR
jgi:hypothetical protein